MIIHRRNINVYFDKVETESMDILVVRGNIRGWELIIVVVYFSVNDRERNKEIRREIEKYVEEKVEEPVIIVGDYNGHVGFKGEQKMDNNGKMIIEWMEKYNLIMLNDVKCEGVYTWTRGDQRSVIDYALANHRFHEKYCGMKIDEGQEKFDLTDHNLIEIGIRVRKGINRYNGKTWITREYYKTDEVAMKVYREKLANSLIKKKVYNMKELESRM